MERIKTSYPEIFKGTVTKESQDASYFFEKWGWYDTLKRVAKDINNLDKTTEINIHTFLMWLAHDIDYMRLEAKLRQKK